jgi:hypothetical protein
MGARFSAHVQTGPGTHPVFCTVETGSFPGVESGRGVTPTRHSLLMPRSKNSRAIPLFSLRAFVACKKGENYLGGNANLLPPFVFVCTKSGDGSVWPKHVAH